MDRGAKPGYSPRGCKELDMTKQRKLSVSLFFHRNLNEIICVITCLVFIAKAMLHMVCVFICQRRLMIAAVTNTPRVSVAYIRGCFFHWHQDRIQANLGDAIFHITSKGLSPLPCCMSTIFSYCSVAKLCPTLCNPMKCSRLPCPSLSPGVCSNSCPLCLWCHPAISFSITPFSPSPQSFPALGSFPMNQLLASGS